MDEKLNLTEVDFKIQNEGTLVVLHPQNDAAREWIDDHIYQTDPETGIPAQEVTWWGGGVVIEPRYLPSIIEGIEADGLDIGSL